VPLRLVCRCFMMLHWIVAIKVLNTSKVFQSKMLAYLKCRVFYSTDGNGHIHLGNLGKHLQ
jgi:hypothetical protein